MQTAPFEWLGAQHWLALAATALFSAALPLAVRAARSARTSGSDVLVRRLAAALGVLLLLGKAAEWIYAWAEGIHWPHLLPLHLSDMAAFATAFMLLTQNRFLYDLAYFWAFTGSLQAMLTPALGRGFPHPDYWFFFGLHGLAIAGAVYATVFFHRPRWRSIPRVFWTTAALALPAALANAAFGTNFMFLARKPPEATLLDYLGPWPWYILSLVPVALASLVLAYAPFWIFDRLRQARARAARLRGPGIPGPS